ncbi:MAG: alpha-amylase [Deltaproteobacteria bacterium]|nr:alpha-amylase [Deltaproteobacteria bacterium]MCB9788908.1 alpha-amylase [Deltaproteobacteria bacterium]
MTKRVTDAMGPQARRWWPAALAALLWLAACSPSEVEAVQHVTLSTEVDDWRDEVIYQLLTDRFANGETGNDVRTSPGDLARYQGGDYQGIVDHLDYLEALGVTALWISPIVLNVDSDAGVDGYHGYWQVDLERLNPHFGDLASLRAMVEACHQRGIKVIVDIVTNHLGQVFYYDINLNGRPDENVYGSGTSSPLGRVTEYDPDYDPRGIQSFTSLGEAGAAPIAFFHMPEIFRVPPNPPIFQRPEAYNRRGRVTDFSQQDQVVYGDFPGGLKDINTENPEVRSEMIRVFTDWVLKTNIDGYRIDTIKHVEYAFWETFAPALRQRLAAAGKDNFLLFGEAFDGDDALVGSYTLPGRLDSVFYFPQKFQVFGDVFMRGGPTRKIQELYEQRASHYGTKAQPNGVGVAPHDLLVNFLDNHDLPRFLFDAPDERALRAALAYLLTEDGVPCIYYGTEQEFSGGNDPANREVLWETGLPTDGETFQWIARLTRIRKAYRALRRGGFTIRWVTERTGAEQDAGVVAFERTTAEGDYALVVVNAQGNHRSETSARTLGGDDMVVGAPAGSVLVDALTGERYTVAAGSKLNVAVEAFGAVILVPEADFVAAP